MGLGKTLLLGFIAGVTILLGLPVGRLRRPAPTLACLPQRGCCRHPAVPGLGRAHRGVGAHRRGAHERPRGQRRDRHCRGVRRHLRRGSRCRPAVPGGLRAVARSGDPSSWHRPGRRLDGEVWSGRHARRGAPLRTGRSRRLVSRQALGPADRSRHRSAQLCRRSRDRPVRRQVADRSCDAAGDRVRPAQRHRGLRHRRPARRRRRIRSTMRPDPAGAFCSRWVRSVGDRRSWVRRSATPSRPSRSRCSS